MSRNKKKIGTLTFHIAHNYGAMLQAYALPTAVQKLGYECEVIDYRFSYIDQWNRIEKVNDLIFRCGFLGGILRWGKRLFTGYYWKNNMHKKFDEFERTIIPHSKRIYRRKNDLDNMPYDVILFGSDQIWNSDITNGVAEEFIGGFVCLPETRKIAYAASCGTSDFQSESKEVYINYLNEFYAISVREESFQKTLVTHGYEAEFVLDPTLLLTEYDWKSIIPPEKTYSDKKYLLIYAFDEDEKIYDLARDYAKVHNLDIIAIAYKKKESMYGMEVLTECGPLEFLSLFANAEHIISASFHGTVFSIIFHKNFHCLPHPKYRERTDSLLNLLDLLKHNLDSLNKLEDVTVDWDKVDKILDEKRFHSLNFLKVAIAGNKIGG